MNPTNKIVIQKLQRRPDHVRNVWYGGIVAFWLELTLEYFSFLAIFFIIFLIGLVFFHFY